MTRPLLSICIPSYNRSEQLSDLLLSIDCSPQSIDIVICEDRSPQREQIRATVESFGSRSPYKVHYFENETNFGYDGNLRRLVELAEGRFILFMGDDDLFVPKALDRFLRFLNEHEDKRYILRSYVMVHPDGGVETFRYLQKTTALLREKKLLPGFLNGALQSAVLQ